MHIITKAEAAYKNNLPFVLYKKPNSNLISGFFQTNNQLFFTESYTESGFVFAPFNNKEKTVLIPERESVFVEESIKKTFQFHLNTNFLEDATAKNQYLKMIEKAVKAIEKNSFKKVVLSRKEEVLVKELDALKTFEKLLTTYPSTMVYLWYHPKVGLWLGATPEVLVKTNNTFFETMALAGTQAFSKLHNVVWQEKEVEEQQFVTDYILEKLKKVSKIVVKHKVETVKAGALLHLKTKITGSFNGNVHKLIKALHPTPAVCGLPKEEAKNYILENENYNRTFYTGFLGELNKKEEGTNNINSSLFVNLRSMCVAENKVSLFVGGGITKDSNPLKEWQETVEKTKTIKAVL